MSVSRETGSFHPKTADLEHVKGWVHATIFPSWGKFDSPDMAQAAGDANSSLSNHTAGAAASIPPAVVVLQQHGPLFTQEGQGLSDS